jgi:hypothetical protein
MVQGVVDPAITWRGGGGGGGCRLKTVVGGVPVAVPADGSGLLVGRYALTSHAHLSFPHTPSSTLAR